MPLLGHRVARGLVAVESSWWSKPRRGGLGGGYRSEAEASQVTMFWGCGQFFSTTSNLLAIHTHYQAAHGVVAILSDLHTDSCGADGPGLAPAPICLPSARIPILSQIVNPTPTLFRSKQLLCLSFHFSLFLSFLFIERGNRDSAPTILREARCIDSKTFFWPSLYFEVSGTSLTREHKRKKKYKFNPQDMALAENLLPMHTWVRERKNHHRS